MIFHYGFPEESDFEELMGFIKNVEFDCVGGSTYLMKKVPLPLICLRKCRTASLLAVEPVR